MTVLELVQPSTDVCVAYYSLTLKSGMTVTAWEYLSQPEDEKALADKLMEKAGMPYWVFGSGHIVVTGEIAFVAIDTKMMSALEAQANEGEDSPEGEAS